MGETFCALYVQCVYNTRLESVFIEKYNILLHKTYMEILPPGSFPDFPKFSRGNFPDGKFPGFPEKLPGKFSRREFSRISRKFLLKMFLIENVVYKIYTYMYVHLSTYRPHIVRAHTHHVTKKIVSSKCSR